MIMVPAPQPYLDPFDELPSRPLDSSFCPSPSAAPLAPAPSLTRLTFEKLSAFEPIRDQYWDVGVRFEGAIALQSSNPAFSNSSEAIGLIPVAGRSNIMAFFRSPRKQVSASLTGARQVRMIAYDCNNTVLTRQSVGEPRYVHSNSSHSDKFRQHEMTLQGEGIAKIVIDSDAPFLLNSLVHG
jgi:hypothetical protein